MSLGSSNDYSTASTTYPVVPNWKSRMEASSRRGAPSTSIRGPRRGLQLSGQPFYLPQWLTSSAWYRAACLPLGAWSLEVVGSFHPPSPLYLSPPSSSFGQLDQFEGVGWVGEWRAWSEEPWQVRPSSVKTLITLEELTSISFGSPFRPLRV